MTSIRSRLLTLLRPLATLVIAGAGIAAAERPLIFPAPREMTVSPAGSLRLDERIPIVVPAGDTGEDGDLARFLRDALGDRYALHLNIERAASLPASKRFILMGSLANPLVEQYCRESRPQLDCRVPGPEGYVLRVTDRAAVVAGSTARGAFYGLQSLRQLATSGPDGVSLRGVDVRDWPDKPFRGIKIYLPGRDNIPFFKRFVRDFMALYKYNTLIMEVNASMRLDRHPELNSGWLEFVRDTNYSRRNYPPGEIHQRERNSTHQDTADGDILEKEEVANLAAFVARHHIELIPEIPSLTHSYFLLSRHPELAEVPGEKWPDTYCPSNPKSYELAFDVMDEYIEVLKPRMIQAGKDELFAPVGLCSRCKGKDMRELFGEDLRKTHAYLAGRGIRMAIWGDYLLEEVRGKVSRKRRTPTGWTYESAGGMTPEQVRRLVPKDILVFNWFWSGRRAELAEASLHELGFQQIYGNFEPTIADYPRRSRRASLIGGAPSAWFATNEFNFGKNLVADFLGCINLLWSNQALSGKEVSGIVQAMMPEVRRRFSGALAPSETEDRIESVDIAPALNSGPLVPGLRVDLSGMSTGRATSGRQVFDLAIRDGKVAVVVGSEGASPNPLPREAGVRIGEDATSLIFLHACAVPATNKHPYRLLFNPEDTADLLGWYEVVYEDGFTVSVPIRYGVNIREWSWDRRSEPSEYCYAADAVPCGGRNPVTLFAYEWPNHRLGKVIQEVRLHGSTRFRGGHPGWTNEFGPVIESNAVILRAISLVKRR